MPLLDSPGLSPSRSERKRPSSGILSDHANVHNHFSLDRHLVDRNTYKERCSAALAEW